nr:unnamed protein product [Spirometra erinaceieuropaei]
MSDAQLLVVDNFMYLSSTLSRTSKIDNKVACRISKAGPAFGSLQSTGGKCHGLHLNNDYERQPKQLFNGDIDTGFSPKRRPSTPLSGNSEDFPREDFVRDRPDMK